MTTDRQELTDRLWDNMGDAERFTRYYGFLADRNQRFHLALSLTAILLAVGAGVTLLMPLPEYVTVVVFMSVATVTAIMLVFDFSRRATVARLVSEELRPVPIVLRDLWGARHSADASELSNKLKEVEDKIYAATRVDLLIDYKLHDRCAEDAYRVLEEQHGEQHQERQRRLASETTKAQASKA